MQVKTNTQLLQLLDPSIAAQMPSQGIDAQISSELLTSLSDNTLEQNDFAQVLNSINQETLPNQELQLFETSKNLKDFSKSINNNVIPNNLVGQLPQDKIVNPELSKTIVSPHVELKDVIVKEHSPLVEPFIEKQDIIANKQVLKPDQEFTDTNLLKPDLSSIDMKKVVFKNDQHLEASTPVIVNAQDLNHSNTDMPILNASVNENTVINQELSGKKDILTSDKELNFNKSEIINNDSNELKSILVKDQKIVNVNKNAEDASRQFTPERKSIFDVKKSQEILIENKNQPLVSTIQNPYEKSVQRSLFKKDLKSKLSEISRPRPDTNIMELMLEQDIKSVDRNIQMPLMDKNSFGTTGQNIAKGSAVFELNNLSNTSDRSVIIDQIQNYIVQAKATNQPRVQMSFHHQELGIVDLQVQKAELGQVNIMITTNTQEGMKFFNQHQGDLLGSLSNSGIKVSDFKLDSNTQGDLAQNNNQHQGYQGQTHDKNQDSKRREELWNLFKQHRDAA